MLEEVEMKFILTDVEGKLIGCYSEFESADMDAKDMIGSEGDDKKLFVYELLNSMKIGDPFLQNIYELRKSYPEEPESEEKEEGGEEKSKTE